MRYITCFVLLACVAGCRFVPSETAKASIDDIPAVAVDNLDVVAAIADMKASLLYQSEVEEKELEVLTEIKDLLSDQQATITRFEDALESELFEAPEAPEPEIAQSDAAGSEAQSPTGKPAPVESRPAASPVYVEYQKPITINGTTYDLDNVLAQYRQRWYHYVNGRQASVTETLRHIQQVHGYSSNRDLTAEQIIRLHSVLHEWEKGRTTLPTGPYRGTTVATYSPSTTTRVGTVIQPTRTRTVRYTSPVRYYYPVQNNCPGGLCPIR